MSAVVKLKKRKPIAVLCHSRRFFDNWLWHGSMSKTDQDKFVFVNRIEHIVGREFYHVITIGEYFDGYHDCLKLVVSRLR